MNLKKTQLQSNYDIPHNEKQPFHLKSDGLIDIRVNMTGTESQIFI